MRSTVLPLICFLSSTLAATAPGVAAADRFNLPAGQGRELVYGHCQTCHDLQSVEDSAGIRKGAWNAVLDNMYDFGLRISDDQRTRILDYLGTYLGPNPPESAKTAIIVENTDGMAVFNDTCVACHQEDGTGKAGEFPPLAGNQDLFLSSDFPAYVVLFGIEGVIEVNGKSFDNVMPPFDFLDDEQIAAVLAYVRSNWGNDKKRTDDVQDTDSAEISKLRAREMSSEDVAALRKSLLP
jgi:mono/diheme cytochrome c family protein